MPDCTTQGRSAARNLRWLSCFALAGAIFLLPNLPAQSSGNTTFAFDVQISLSQKAAARLASQSETIIVSSRYFGDPVPGAEKHTNQIGQIDLGVQRDEVPGRSQTVHVDGAKVFPNRLAWIQGPAMLNVNVYSGRHSSSNNLLECNFFDDKLQNAVREPLKIHCTLIGEKPETSNTGIPPIPQSRLADSYAIYSLLLPGARFDTISPSQIRHWSLADTTVNINDMNPAIPPDGQLKAPPDNEKGFDEALQDFQTRRYERFQLDSTDFHPSQPSLIGSQQIAELRRTASGNTGVAFFSAVYFDTKQAAALVYVNNWCANLCAVGQWVYFEKQNGQWVRRSGLISGGA
jgi:hypothetical protein